MEISDDSVIRMGYFIKSPPAVDGIKGKAKRWYRRWFVLCRTYATSEDESTRTVLLYYFENRKAFRNRKEPKGRIELDTCIEIKRHQECINKKHEAYDHSVVIVTKTDTFSRTYYLCNDDYKEREDWYQDIAREMQDMKWRKKSQCDEDDADYVRERTSYLPAEPNPIEMEIERIRGMSLLDDESSGDCEDEDYIDIDHDDVYEEITDDTNNPSVRVSALSGYASIYSSDTPEKENTTKVGKLSDLDDDNSNDDELIASFTGPKLFNSSPEFVKSKSMSNLSYLPELNELSLTDQRTIGNGRSSSDCRTNLRRFKVSNYRGTRCGTALEGFRANLQRSLSDSRPSSSKVCGTEKISDENEHYQQYSISKGN